MVNGRTKRKRQSKISTAGSLRHAAVPYDVDAMISVKGRPSVFSHKREANENNVELPPKPNAKC